MPRDNKLLWWEQSSAYWQLPFFAEMGYWVIEDRGAREQLWAIREGLAKD